MELVRIGNHGHIESMDLYHETVRIRDRLKKWIWIKNKMEMRAQTMANVVCIFVVPIPSLLHQNNIGITYA